MPQIIWGPGLTSVLRTLPPLILIPILASSLPTVFARALPSSTLAQAFLNLPTPLRGLLSYLAFLLTREAVSDYLRYRDRKRLGPDVVEAPRLKMRWPWNLDFIPYTLRIRKTGKLGCLRKGKGADKGTDYCVGMWLELLKGHGNTVNMRLFGEDQVSSSVAIYQGALLIQSIPSS
jgi:hypothetical protein